ncbi:MAG TPA: amidohydrolase family protein [Longimicrobium sp.]|jgi:predicted TIM-barrel fold metal-dependent hydrolase|uniref:amidohydrolase family protein n=1 Tax=Longimicrobium sp. TaxID=2029185 RepID=UPI002EDA342A
MSPPKIDMHVHLAGQGTDDSGCWVSPMFTRRMTYKLLRLRHGPRDAGHADAEWAAELASRVLRSELDHAVALGFDGVYDRAGRLDPARSQMIVPAPWVFQVCRRHPELIPGPSVNPHRRDALERLEECVEGGAALIKWLPATQGIDPADRSLEPFYRRLAETGIPILVHSGGSENTFAEVQPELKDLRRILFPLEQGVRMIVAHTGAPVLYARDPDQVPMLKRMLERFPHLWVDNSGISNPSRFPHLPVFARDPELVARTVHGSDFPVPSNAFWYVRQLGPRGVAALERIRNRMQRDVEIKRALGYPDAVLTRAPEVLANLDRWIPHSAI